MVQTQSRFWRCVRRTKIADALNQTLRLVMSQEMKNPESLKTAVDASHTAVTAYPHA
jgi:hypothetical protein